MLLKPIDPCSTCLGYSWSQRGYVPASGSGENGVLVVAEAAGENEVTEGTPLIGKAGHFLWQQLSRVGVEREGFKVHNVLSCRPPDNKLSKMPWEQQVIDHCAPLLDATIFEMQEKCSQIGKYFTIVTLGRTAFKRILGLDEKDPILREEYLCYPFWSDKYQAFVIAGDHPSYLARGNTHLVPILQFAFKRALEIATGGLTFDKPEYLLDPDPSTFSQWVQDYLKALDRDPSTPLSYDIETPYKQKQGSEAELVKDEDGDDYRILRCSFAYEPNRAVSVKWTAEYLPYLEQLFGWTGTKVSWNGYGYDDARIQAQLPIRGPKIDAMLAWHVLNAGLDKSLGFVTPFYVKSTSLWKHLADKEPAYYNAKDADMTLRNFLGIKRDLIQNNQWDVFNRHVIQVHQVFDYMSEKGVLLDQEMRAEAEVKLQDLLDVTELKMEAAVPQEARKLKVYKKTPKDTTGMIQVEWPVKVKVCFTCGEERPKKTHSKLCTESSEISLIEFPTQLWAKPLPFKVSKVGLSAYQKALRHQAIINRKEKKVTFDEKAIMQLMKHHPSDPLYPLILEHRSTQKLLSVYIGVTQESGKIKGGMPVGLDGRVHASFTSNPATLRSACQDPNLQNIPRPNPLDPQDPANIIRNLFVAGPQQLLGMMDYSGIEAVLVGYFAMAPSYIRLALRDVHSYYTAYALHTLDGRLSANDLPLLSWSDEKLFGRLAEIKAEFKQERNSLYKHLVHAINFGQGTKGAADKILSETGISFPLHLISKVMGIYKELFPEIPRWQQGLLIQVEKDGFLRNPFGYTLKFTKPFEYEKIGGLWQKSQGPDANKIWAYLPQSTAAGIIKEAMLRLFQERFEEAGQYLRLLIHDELFSEIPDNILARVLGVMKEEMEKPIPQLPLPASYKMGSHLSIFTEAKSGLRWGQAK